MPNVQLEYCGSTELSLLYGCFYVDKRWWDLPQAVLTGFLAIGDVFILKYFNELIQIFLVSDTPASIVFPHFLDISNYFFE